MPVYEFLCQSCSHEWEEQLKFSDPNPNKCPECKKKGKIKKLISLCSPGKVPLKGRELTQSLWNEGKKLARKAKKDENLAANIQSESNFHEMKLKETKLNKELKGVFKRSK